MASEAISNVLTGEKWYKGLGGAALSGALEGALTVAFPGASTLISVGISVAESVVQDVREGENVATIVVNAAISAGFAAIADGATVFDDKNIVSKSLKAVKEMLPGNHPAVKKSAKKFLTRVGKALRKEMLGGIADNLLTGYVEKGTRWYTGVYTGSKEVYGN
jgi:hypothetical protein